jgi:oxygen-independent coproporphyrinogen III oxidase
MAGIYIHIPFCKQACHYCDFHFSTVMKKSSEMVAALVKEIALRKDDLAEVVETIYFGGGTPSVLSMAEIDALIDAVYNNFNIADNPEITLEANPDDLTSEKIQALARSRVNRLSIGIQSFFDSDLKMMNRAHNATEAEQSLAEAAQYFDNISIDLIYGIPGMDNERWLQNIEKALSFGIPHISSYALTVEPKTAMQKMIASGQMAAPADDVASEHFKTLTNVLDAVGFVHYELSNFGKPGYFSRNNSAYWLGKKYVGFGPSAHSYDGRSRSWNVANNTLYLKALAQNALPSEKEMLSKTDRYNEYIMTGLRTIWGVSLDKIESEFGIDYLEYLEAQSDVFLQEGLLEVENRILKPTPKGKFLTDGIASDLFYVD